MKVIKLLAALAAFSALGTHAAGAVDVRQVAEIKAAPAAVWAKIGESCAIKDWHPAIAGCQAGKRGFRTLTLKDGGKILEKITKTGRNTYSYDIVESPLPVKNYKASLTAKADSLGSTDLTWTAKFDAAKGKTDQEAAAVINGIFEAGLKNIKSNVKFDSPVAPAAGTAPAAGAAAVGAGAAATAPQAVTGAAARDEAKLKAREERQKRLAAAKLAALEKYARVKAAVAEKAKATADAAKAAYEKAKAAVAGLEPKKQ